HSALGPHDLIAAQRKRHTAPAAHARTKHKLVLNRHATTHAGHLNQKQRAQNRQAATESLHFWSSSQERSPHDASPCWVFAFAQAELDSNSGAKPRGNVRPGNGTIRNLTCSLCTATPVAVLQGEWRFSGSAELA